MFRVLLILTLCFGCKNAKGNHTDPDLTKANGPMTCVEMVLEQDSILGSIRNQAPEKITLSQAITNYTNNLMDLNFSNCPEEFRLAFQSHIQAWVDIKKITDKHEYLRGELHTVFSELERSVDSVEFKSLLKAIWDTWYLVEENAKPEPTNDRQ